MVMSITFWGVRGTIPCPMASHIQCGGNTSCVQIVVGGRQFICDAGTGIRLLGKQYLARGVREATLLLSHTHLDHISGFPFFGPAFQPGFRFRVMAGHLYGATDIASVLARQMDQPLFPVPMRTMGCEQEFVDFTPGSSMDLGGGVALRTARLNHPDGATGYRLSAGGYSVAYITDTEHYPDHLDENILALVEGVDLLIYDSTYTDEEYLARIGWGHSTWQEAVKLGRAAQVKQLALFHHEPDHDDEFMRRVEADAQASWPGRVFVAREGNSLAFG